MQHQFDRITLHSKHPALGVKFIILLLVHYTSLHTMHLISAMMGLLPISISLPQMPRVLIGLHITNSNIINLTSPNVSNDNLREHMDDTNDQCQMFKNKLD